MKKIIVFLLVLMTGCLSINAQSPVYRNGNSYMVDGQMMNKKAYKGYLQNTCPEAFNKFNSGYKTANAGWGLFGAGLGLETAAIAMAIATPAIAVDKKEVDDKTMVGLSTGMALSYVTGSLMTTAGIVCLAVGYAKMHSAADMYNTSCAKKPVAELHLTAGRNAVGLACKF